MRRILLLLLCVPSAFQAAESLPKYLTLDKAMELSSQQIHPGVGFYTQDQQVRNLQSCRETQQPLYKSRLPESRCSYLHFISPQARQQLLVMRRFFDVILADTANATDNEILAIDFIDFDRIKDRSLHGQKSELEVGEAESLYQKTLVSMLNSQAMQRITRSLLAIEMNMPNELADELITPEMALLNQIKIDEDAVINSVMQHNPVLALTLKGNNDSLKHMVKRYLPHATIELLLSIDIAKARQRAAETAVQWRNALMDRNRTLYQLDVKADLGDSMGLLSAAKLEKLEADFELYLLLQALRALQNQPVGVMK